MGDIDELNAHLGLLIEQLNESSIAECAEWVPFLRYCQHRIFDLGGEFLFLGLNSSIAIMLRSLRPSWIN